MFKSRTLIRCSVYSFPHIADRQKEPGVITFLGIACRVVELNPVHCPATIPIRQVNENNWLSRAGTASTVRRCDATPWPSIGIYILCIVHTYRSKDYSQFTLNYKKIKHFYNFFFKCVCPVILTMSTWCLIVVDSESIQRGLYILRSLSLFCA